MTTAFSKGCGFVAPKMQLVQVLQQRIIPMQPHASFPVQFLLFIITSKKADKTNIWKKA